MESSNDNGLWMLKALNAFLFGVVIAFRSILPRKVGKLIQESFDKIVTDGYNSSISSLQYSGLFPISIGMLIQWSISLTLIIWSFLIYAYYRLALREERDVMKVLPLQYEGYRQNIAASVLISKTNNIYYNEE